MDFRFSDDFIEVFEISRDEALRTGWHNICPDHIILGILRHRANVACDALEALGISADAFKTALDEALFVDEQIPWEERDSINLSEAEAKTKNIVKMLKALGADRKALIVTKDVEPMVVRAAGNIQDVKTTFVGSLNVVDILNCDKFIISQDAVKLVEEVYAE